MVKLVYTPDLGSGAARRGGSSPLIRTTHKLNPHKTLQQQAKIFSVTAVSTSIHTFT